ncbi:unnamed protein product [Lactuca virosa]|uniref:Uncharacterized protein n=1 Tax=Lactuca virosa TaxID=75947 RepID=A0AAU9NNX1_9ASTR|nr:unnamed protein product [Lactuca virosa]
MSSPSSSFDSTILHSLFHFLSQPVNQKSSKTPPPFFTVDQTKVVRVALLVELRGFIISGGSACPLLLHQWFLFSKPLTYGTESSDFIASTALSVTNSLVVVFYCYLTHLKNLSLHRFFFLSIVFLFLYENGKTPTKTPWKCLDDSVGQ